MDYYQNVVVDYLRADRAVFVNTECCIQLIDHPNPDRSGLHWYCDAVAVDFRSKTIFLCEISYSKSLGALIERLTAWNQHWPELCDALRRDCSIPADLSVIRLWLFVPEKSITALVNRLEAMKAFQPRITSLENVHPWEYSSWNHQDKDTGKSLVIPEHMRH